MKWLRIISWLKRTALALEAIHRELERIANVYVNLNRPKLPGKMTEVERFDYEEANKKWDEYVRRMNEGG
jgi:hypothetical protein